MPNETPSTSVKRHGRDGLRIDVLTHGQALGVTVAVPQLMWHAQTVPHYDYLLAHVRDAALLAGGHCIPLQLPEAHSLMWHKLYSSGARQSFPEKAAKDLLQAATLAAVLIEQQDETLTESLADVPEPMRTKLAARLPSLRKVLTGHPRALDEFESALAAG